MGLVVLLRSAAHARPRGPVLNAVLRHYNTGMPASDGGRSPRLGAAT
jgi:hypothetical protein